MMVIVLVDGMGAVQGPLTVEDSMSAFKTREVIPQPPMKDTSELHNLLFWDTVYVPNGRVTTEGYHIFVPEFMLTWKDVPR